MIVIDFSKLRAKISVGFPMVRISKQQERRSVSRRRPSRPGKKTGSKKDALTKGYKEHLSGFDQGLSTGIFIPKI